MGSEGSSPPSETVNGSLPAQAGNGLLGGTISHYRIIERLGGGGLGEIYKAEDVNAKRIVAQRVIAAGLVSNEESKRRFFEEAAAALELDHPNICPVYDAAETGDLVFLASEYLEGLTLESLLRQGPFHPEDAVNVARQVADALEAGRSCDIVHRSIKPSNIFLIHTASDDPLVKVTDFGLAYLAGQSKMQLNGKTQIAVAYISPEQTQWTTTDHRTDIWSLGVVLYEMLTARRPFRGEDGASIIRSVLNDDYEPASKLRSGLPPALDKVIGRCLSKDPDQRYQSAGELADVLGDVLPRRSAAPTGVFQEVEVEPVSEAEILPEPEIVEPVPAEPVSMPPSPMEIALPPWKMFPMFRPGREKFWKRVAGAALGLAIAAFAYHFLSRPAPRLRKYNFSPAGVEVPEGRAAIAPNGRLLAYVAGSGPSRLYVQDLGEDTPREIEGSDGASRPFWSPDSQWIGFLAGGDIKKAPLDGGAVKTVCAVSHASEHFSASWSPDGRTIVFSGDTPHRVFTAQAGGGYPDVLIEPADGQPAVTFAQFLAGDANSLLVAMGTTSGATALINLRTGERRDLPVKAGFLAYSSTGHLLYQDDLLHPGPLWAVRFSPGSGAIDGEPFQVRERADWPSVSADGTLAYRDPGGPWVERLTWRARNGDTIGLITRSWQHISQPTLSRDGRRILVAAEDADYTGIWTYEATGNQWIQETSGKATPFLAQSPLDGRFAYSGNADGIEGLFVGLSQAQGGAGSRPSLQGSGDLRVTDWSRDGTQIIFHRKSADGPNDIWRVAAQLSGAPAAPVAVVRSPNDERDAALSRDGQWIAYVSDRSGSADIYVAPYPAGGPETRVSREGGTQPRWSPTGDEIYFVQGDWLMTVTVTTNPSVAVSKPQPLFADPGLAIASEPGERRYDVSPDGQRFVIVTPSLEPAGTPAAIRVAENWFEEFRQ